MGNTLFSYPATLPAHESPKRHLVSVPSDGTEDMQFILERASRSLHPGDSIVLSDYEYAQINQTFFEEGRLTYGGALDDIGDNRVLSLPIVLADLPAVGGEVLRFEAPFDGRIFSWRFIVTDPTVTASDLATLQPRIGSVESRRDFVGVNEEGTLTEGGSGLTSFTLTFGGQTTASLDDDASAATVQAALEALSTIGAGNILVTAGPLGTAPFEFEFINDLGGTNVGAITTTPTGGTGTVTAAVVTAGAAYTLALTSANTDAQGDVVAGTLTDTAEAAFSEGDIVTVEVIALTAFAEGEGILELRLIEV
jgi:hypothetical protein